MKQVMMIHNLIVAQQKHWCFYIIVYLFLVLTQADYSIPGMHLIIWLLFGMVPVLFLWIGMNVKKRKRFLYSLVILIYLAGAFCMPVPHSIYRGTYFFCIIFYYIYALFFDVSDEDCDENKPVSVYAVFGITFIVVLILQIMKLYEYQRSFVYLMIINVILSCLAGCVNNYAKYLKLNKHSIGYMPIKEALYSGITTMLSFSVLVSAILTIVASIGRMGDVLHYIVELVESLKEKIRQKITNKKITEIGEMPELKQEMENVAELMQIEEKLTIWDILSFLLFFIVVLMVLYKIVRLLMKFISWLMYFRPDSKPEAVSEVHESCDVVETLKKRKRESFFKSLLPAQIIRKRYRNKVLVEKNRIALEPGRSRIELYTARECSAVLDNLTIAEIYEKARYSPYECTAEDVKQMKNACKKRK